MVVNKQIETSSWINIVLGVAVMGVGYFYTTSFDMPFYVALAAGAVILLSGAFSAWAAATDRTRTTMWPAIASLLAGLVLIAYPWFAAVVDTYFYAMIAAGVVAAIVSGYEIYASSVSETPTRRGRAA